MWYPSIISDHVLAFYWRSQFCFSCFICGGKHQIHKVDFPLQNWTYAYTWSEGEYMYTMNWTITFVNRLNEGWWILGLSNRTETSLYPYFTIKKYKWQLDDWGSILDFLSVLISTFRIFVPTILQSKRDFFAYFLNRSLKPLVRLNSGQYKLHHIFIILYSSSMGQTLSTAHYSLSEIQCINYHIHLKGSQRPFPHPLSYAHQWMYEQMGHFSTFEILNMHSSVI